MDTSQNAKYEPKKFEQGGTLPRRGQDVRPEDRRAADKLVAALKNGTKK